MAKSTWIHFWQKASKKGWNIKDASKAYKRLRKDIYGKHHRQLRTSDVDYYWKGKAPKRKAKKNGLALDNQGLPAVNTNMVVGGVILGGVGWTAWRFQQRAALVKLLSDDAGIMAVRMAFKGRLPPSDLAWVVEPGGLRKKAAEVIPIFGTNNALQAYDQIMEQMPAVEMAGEATSAADQLISDIEGATGLDLPSLEQLFEGVAPAAKNPHMEWDEYLDVLNHY
jgi:hypothetical protein